MIDLPNLSDSASYATIISAVIALLSAGYAVFSANNAKKYKDSTAKSAEVVATEMQKITKLNLMPTLELVDYLFDALINGSPVTPKNLQNMFQAVRQLSNYNDEFRMTLSPLALLPIQNKEIKNKIKDDPNVHGNYNIKSQAPQNIDNIHQEYIKLKASL